MAGPLDVELVTVVERQLDALPIEFIRDDAIVDPADGHQAPVAVVEQLPSFAPHRRRVHRAHAPEYSVMAKSGHVFCHRGSISISTTSSGRMAPEDGGADRGLVGGEIVPAEKDLQRRGQRERVSVGVGEDPLQAVERGKGLQLDQSRLDSAVSRPHQPEVHLQEARDRILVRSGEPLRHNLIRRGARGVVVHELADQLFAGPREIVDERAREEAGRLRTGKVGATPAAALRMERGARTARESKPG